MISVEAIIFLSALVIIAFLVWLLALILNSVNQCNPNDAAGANDEGNSSDKFQAQAQSGIAIVAVANAIHAYRRARHTHEHQSGKREKQANAILGATCIFAFMAAIAAIASGWVFYEQLEELRDEQRPWVYAASVSPGGRIVLVDEKYAIPLKITIKNTGHLPAFWVTPKTAAYVLPYGQSTHTIKNQVCDEYRGNIRYRGGETVFAGQTIGHEGFTTDDYPTVEKRIWETTGSGKTIIIYGCIDYQFPAKPGHHQSRFSLLVGVAVNEGALERLKFLPDDPTTVDIRFKPANTGGDEPPN